jgi:hypothetical protein
VVVYYCEEDTEVKDMEENDTADNEIIKGRQMRMTGEDGETVK